MTNRTKQPTTKDTTKEGTMQRRTRGTSTILFFLLAVALPAGAQESPIVLPSYCEPGGETTEGMRAWCEEQLSQGAILPSQRSETEVELPALTEAEHLTPEAAAVTLPDAGPAVPEPVLEEIPSLPRRSTDARAAARMETRVAAALRTPLQRIEARVGALDERRARLEAAWEERASFLTRSPDELLRQMTGQASPDLFELLEQRRRRGPGR